MCNLLFRKYKRKYATISKEASNKTISQFEAVERMVHYYGKLFAVSLGMNLRKVEH